MKKTIPLIIAAILLICLTLSACNQPSADVTPPSSSPSVSIQGGLEDSTFFDDIPSSGTSQPSTSTPASQPSSSAPTSQPSTSAPATQPSSSVPATQPSTSAPATKPSTSPAGPDTSMTYEQFQAMTGAEQRAFQASFPDIDAFFEWYNAAKETYEKENPSIEIGGDGVVDLDGLLGGGN